MTHNNGHAIIKLLIDSFGIIKYMVSELFPVSMTQYVNLRDIEFWRTGVKKV